MTREISKPPIHARVKRNPSLRLQKAKGLNSSTRNEQSVSVRVKGGWLSSQPFTNREYPRYPTKLRAFPTKNILRTISLVSQSKPSTRSFQRAAVKNTKTITNFAA